MRKALILGLLLYGSILNGISQNSFKLDRPRIKNFSKSIYHADNQNWSIGQDKQGTLYFANSQGLLTFDGVSWNLYPLPKNTIARSVEVTDGKIYVGSYEEFGFFEKADNGGMRYTSLKNLVKNFEFHNEDIWKIITTNGITYFQSFSVIFAYNGKEIEVIQPPGLISCFANIDGKLLLIISNHGLYELKESKIMGIDSSVIFRQQMTRVLLPYGQRKILVATSDNGIYTYDYKGNFKPWGNNIEAGFLTSSINRGTVSKAGLIIIGTILNGIYAFDSIGNVIYHINKENGLQNNTVLGEMIDADGYLWAGLDNGIDLVNLGSGVTFYYDLAGRLGSVYSVLLKNGLLYAGTNQGLFYSKFEPANGNIKLDFKFIENSQGQVWSLFEFNNQLFCGHNDRTYEIVSNKIIPLAQVSGGFSFCEFRHNSEDYLLQCTYTDLVLYKKQNGRWVFGNKIQNFLNPVRFIEVDHFGNIWASHLQRGLFRLKLNEDLSRIAETESYGIKKGFSSDYHISVFKLQNRVVFTNEGQVFIYNDLADTIVRFDFIEDQIKKNSKVNSIIHAGNQNYWFITEKTLDLYEFATGKVLLKKSYSFELFDNKLIHNNEYIYPIDSSRWILCLENGIALINSASEQNVMPAKKVLINKVVSQGRKEIVISNGIEDNIRPVSLTHSQNSVIFYFSCPVYDSKLNFYVRLDGIDRDWNQLDLAYYKYDRLPWGNYTFHVKAIDGKGNLSQESTFSFTVLAPWYWSIWSQLIYAAVLVVMFILIRRYFLFRLKNTETRIRIQKERELIRVKNEKLQSEIHYKSMQLANTTYSITKKNELLLEIKKLLSRSTRNTDLKNPFKEIHKLLDQNITNEDDWKIFESNFEQAHEEFLLRIKKQYPNLTPSDLKLCAFIRMNLPSKRIAPLLVISIRGVENHRHRLRKKMELDRETNLTDYLMSF
jgi:ligand-binding sensor domain-containing protein/DNA-binding CsgD family transcriptional regulator